MDQNKTVEVPDCSFANLYCYSPIIPCIGFEVGLDVGAGGSWTESEKTTFASEALELVMCPVYPNALDIFTNMRIEKSHWVCDYSDDIFQTLRETEIRRNMLTYQSEQYGFRPTLLRLLKVATEIHGLSRTTLHLAVYLLDGFMDNYTIRPEKLNLTALTCLIIAAKIEEVEVNAPKFIDLNKLVGEVYTLDDFRKVEMKILMLFHFDLIRPTAATFAEFFANNIITLDDFHIYMHKWHGGIYDYNAILQRQQLTDTTTTEIIPPIYRTYEEMAAVLSKLLFNLVDETLNYIKFVNVRPSIIVASCIAAVRHISFISPTWTPYLVKTTECTEEMVEGLMEAIVALHNLYLSKTQAMLYGAAKHTNTITNGATLCDSPESGFVSICDTKSESSDEESDYEDDEMSNDEVSRPKCVPVLGKRKHSETCNSNDVDEGADEAHQTNTTHSNLNEYRLLGKRRKLMVNNSGVV